MRNDPRDICQGNSDGVHKGRPHYFLGGETKGCHYCGAKKKRRKHAEGTIVSVDYISLPTWDGGIGGKPLQPGETHIDAYSGLEIKNAGDLPIHLEKMQYVLSNCLPRKEESA